MVAAGFAHGEKLSVIPRSPSITRMSAARDFDPTRFIAGFERVFTAAADLMFVNCLTRGPGNLFKAASDADE
jgi:hypothetical protein